MAELGPRWCEVGWRKACPASPAEDIGEALLGTALGRQGVRGVKQRGIGKASFVDGEPGLGPNANGFMLF